jgi:hypothetical protein
VENVLLATIAYSRMGELSLDHVAKPADIISFILLTPLEDTQNALL